ncbi:Putative glycosyltransferase EpsH [Gemmata sp. SH-PL17]|uniref:glycosyltransferase n=1 Tax=Gemmata sp. SH-PL17 TaxID=1630693 RepID=UPI00078BFE40|nr:glycosyltransferase [Gemmata sp. SH-PL17]AMV25186.1 Putative glycosyltransferase EpsH [Gemmata sp. SH-PL17]
MPAISVIMPVFNGAPFLDRALASLRAQTLTDWELVAVDDASRDESARALDAFAAADPRARVLRHATNRGQAAARNTALRAARGELIAYLDQDDEFYPDHLARAWSLRGRGDVLVFRYDLVEERPDHPGCGTVATYDPGARARAMFEETIAVPLGVVHYRALLARTGLFDEALGRYRHQDEDGDLWRRFVRAGAAFAYVPERSGRYHVRGDSFARTRPPAPPPVRQLTTVEIHTAKGRFSLWLPVPGAELVHRVFARHEYGGLAPAWLRGAPVVWDVGAGAGVFALYAELVYGPGAVVHCFEPDPAARDLLRANAAPFAGIIAHPFGLGGASGADHAPTARPLEPHERPTAGREPEPIRNAGHVWDALAPGEIDVLKLSVGDRGGDVLGALGPRVDRVRVVLAEHPNGTCPDRIGAFLPGHVPFGLPEPGHAPRILKYVRADVARSAGSR